MARTLEPKRRLEGITDGRRLRVLALSVAAAVSGPTLAQLDAATEGSGGAAAPAAAAAVTPTGKTGSGEVASPGPSRALRVEPSVNARFTYTDNVGASRDKKDDLVFEVSPGLAVARESGRIAGQLRAQLRNVAYANETDRSSSFLALSGRGHAEAIERLLFVDADVAVNRRGRSELLGRATGDFLSTDESNETRKFSVGPRAEFAFGADGRATLSYMSRWLDGNGGLQSRQVGEWRALASDPTATGRFGWGIDYMRSDTSYDDQGDSKVYQQTARATLFVTVSPQFRLRGIVGHESTDYTEQDGESGRIVGGGFDWFPTERTALSATLEDRIFGRGYKVSLAHRRPQSTWELSYSRDITSSLETFGSPFNDPNFVQLYNLLEVAIPDPIERENEALRILEGSGFDVRENVVTKAYFLDRRLRAGASLIGVRNVLSVSLVRSDRERLDTFTTLDLRDEFALFERVRSDSVLVSLSHRLSGLSSLNANVSRLRSKGSGTTDGETRRTILSLGLNTRISPKTSGALTYRYQRAEGLSDFIENALTASLSVRF